MYRSAQARRWLHVRLTGRHPGARHARWDAPARSQRRCATDSFTASSGRRRAAVGRLGRLFGLLLGGTVGGVGTVARGLLHRLLFLLLLLFEFALALLVLVIRLRHWILSVVAPRYSIVGGSVHCRRDRRDGGDRRAARVIRPGLRPFRAPVAPLQSWRSGGAPSSHLRQGSSRPMAASRPAAVCVQGRFCQGGSWRTCWLWPQASRATQWPSWSRWKPTMGRSIPGGRR